MHGQAWGATIAPAAATMRAPPWHGSLTSAARLHARENRQESSEAPQKGDGEQKKLAITIKQANKQL